MTTASKTELQFFGRGLYLGRVFQADFDLNTHSPVPLSLTILRFHFA